MGKMTKSDAVRSMRSNGANWVTSRCIIEHHSSQGTQIFLSLSPEGDNLAYFARVTYLKRFKMFKLPLGLHIPEGVSDSEIANRLSDIYDCMIFTKDVFRLKTSLGWEFALAFVPYCCDVYIYALLPNGHEMFSHLS